MISDFCRSDCCLLLLLLIVASTNAALVVGHIRDCFYCCCAYSRKQLSNVFFFPPGKGTQYDTTGSNLCLIIVPDLQPENLPRFVDWWCGLGWLEWFSPCFLLSLEWMDLFLSASFINNDKRTALDKKKASTAKAKHFTCCLLEIYVHSTQRQTSNWKWFT